MRFTAVCYRGRKSKLPVSWSEMRRVRYSLSNFASDDVFLLVSVKKIKNSMAMIKRGEKVGKITLLTAVDLFVLSFRFPPVKK